MHRRGLALVALVVAALAVVATSPRKWNLHNAPSNGSLTIPANAASTRRVLTLRLVPAARAGTSNTSFSMEFTALHANGLAHLRGRTGGDAAWRDLAVSTSRHAMLWGTTSAPCSAAGCSARFELEATRDGGDPGAPVTIEWTASTAASAIGDSVPPGLRLEVVETP